MFQHYSALLQLCLTGFSVSTQPERLSDRQSVLSLGNPSIAHEVGTNHCSMNQVPYEIVGRHVNFFNHRSHMEILNVL